MQSPPLCLLSWWLASLTASRPSISGVQGSFPVQQGMQGGCKFNTWHMSSQFEFHFQHATVEMLFLATCWTLRTPSMRLWCHGPRMRCSASAFAILRSPYASACLVLPAFRGPHRFDVSRSCPLLHALVVLPSHILLSCRSVDFTSLGEVVSSLTSLLA